MTVEEFKRLTREALESREGHALRNAYNLVQFARARNIPLAAQQAGHLVEFLLHLKKGDPDV